MLYDKRHNGKYPAYCVHAPCAGDVTIIALAVFHLEKLPCAPCVAVSDKQLEHIISYDVVILVRPQNLIGATGQIVSGFPFFESSLGKL